MGLAASLTFRVGIALLMIMTSVFVFESGKRSQTHQLPEGHKLSSHRQVISDSTRQLLVASLRGASEAETLERIKTLAIMVPLDELPYEAAMVLAASNNQRDQAIELAEHALSRQPRSLAARLYFFQIALDARLYDEVFAQYERLYELGSLDRKVLTSAIVDFFRDSDDWSPLLAYLLSEPGTGPTLLERLFREPELPIEFDEVIVKYPSTHANYLNKILPDRGFKEAFELWKRLTSVSDEELEKVPFNGSFYSRVEPPPFNWAVHSTRAEFNTPSGLVVYYNGAGEPLIAKQVFSAPAGDYTLSTKAFGRIPRNGGIVEWRLHCVTNSALLAKLEVAPTQMTVPQRFQTLLAIPDTGCEFQSLELRGRPGNMRISTSLELTEVSLERIQPR